MSEWDAIRPAPRAADTDRASPATTEFAIVGAGLTGLTLAYRLASAGRRVVVLEAEHVGHGASLRNAGFCTASAPIDAASALRRYGPDRGREFLRWFLEAPELVRQLLAELNADGEWTPSTRLVLARTRSDAVRLQQEAKSLRDVSGRGVDYLGAGEISSHIGFGRFEGALRDEHSACLNPAKLLAALLRACLSSNVDVFERSRVTRLDRLTDGYRLHHTGGVLEAARVVLATQGGPIGLERRFGGLSVPVGSFIVATHPIGEEVRDRIAGESTVFSTNSRFPNYFRLTREGRLLFGGRRSLSYEDSPGLIAAEIVADLRRVLPGLEFELDRCWSGRLAFPLDRNWIPCCISSAAIAGMAFQHPWHAQPICHGFFWIPRPRLRSSSESNSLRPFARAQSRVCCPHSLPI